MPSGSLAIFHPTGAGVRAASVEVPDVPSTGELGRGGATKFAARAGDVWYRPLGTASERSIEERRKSLRQTLLPVTPGDYPVTCPKFAGGAGAAAAIAFLCHWD